MGPIRLAGDRDGYSHHAHNHKGHHAHSCKDDIGMEGKKTVMSFSATFIDPDTKEHKEFTATWNTDGTTIRDADLNALMVQFQALLGLPNSTTRKVMQPNLPTATGSK